MCSRVVGGCVVGLYSDVLSGYMLMCNRVIGGCVVGLYADV